MKKTLKKAPPLAETLLEQEETKGKTISVYLNAENLRYLDQLRKVLGKKGRGQTVQWMITTYKESSRALIPLIPKHLSDIADKIREMTK